MDATHHDGWWEALFYGDSREIGSAYWSLVTMHFRYTTCWFHVYYRKSVYWKYYHGSFTLKRGGGERDFLKDANGLQCVFMDISALKQLSNASWDSLRNIKLKEKGGVVFGHHCIYADFHHKTFYFSNTTTTRFFGMDRHPLDFERHQIKSFLDCLYDEQRKAESELRRWVHF